MTLKIKIKSVYGNELIYPACKTAELFSKLLGKKTFNRQNLHWIELLGYTIEQVDAYQLGVEK